MKKFTLILIGVFFASMVVFSQQKKITLNLNNVTVKEALEAIKKTGGYTYWFEAKDLDITQKVSINVVSKNIDEILVLLFNGQKVDYTIKNGNIVIRKSDKKNIPIQKKTELNKITGLVTDSKGEPIIGASVILKGSNTGTITNIDGTFSLDVQDQSEITISYIGYKQTFLKIGKTNNYKIILEEDSKELDEIVVVGYGFLKKGNITSSISSLKREDFIQGDVTSPVSLIKGKVAGLMVTKTSGDPTRNDGGVQIMLRGVSNLTGNQQPLIVVDGIAGASLDAISPDDVESIDVLKDGSAAAIYGTRGNNGVIIVTTKKGASNKKTVNVDYHGYTSYETISNRIQTFNAEDFLKLPETTQGKALNAVTNLGSVTDWFNTIYQTPINQNHNISIRGGDAASNVIMTINYQEQQGILKNSGKEQLQVRLAANQSMWNGKLRFYGNAVGTIVNSTYADPSNYFNTLLVNPTASIKDATTGVYTLFQDSSNPVQEINEKNTDTKWDRFSLNGKITFEPINNLNLSAVGSTERFQSIEGTFATYQYYNGDANKGEVWRSSKFNELKTFEFLSDYSLAFSDVHKVTFLLGYSYQEHNWEGFSLYNYNFPTELLSYNKPGLGLALKDGNASMDGYKAQSKLISGFARINYSLKDKYIAAVSVRREGSSKFGVNHKWGLFPSISTGWKISKEPFFRSSKWIDELKIRAGYGVTGAEPNDPYLSINRYSYSNPVLSDGSWIWGVGPSVNNNPDLRWETKKEFNLGIDYSFIKGRISGSIDLYNRRTDDLIYTYQVPVPPNLVSDIYANVGSITNSGIEVLFSTIPIQKKNFVWNITTNFSFNHNNLDKLSNDMYQRDFLETGATGAPIQKTTHIVREGEPIGNFFGWKSSSISADGKNWLDANGNVITFENSNREVLGNGIPSFQMGISSSIRYKGFDGSISLRGVGGFQILNQYRMLWETFMKGGNHNYPLSILNKPYGVDTYVYTAPSYVSYYIENGDYLKIDNVTIGYTFKFQKYVEKLRLYVSGLNLYTLTGYTGVDPEVNMLGLSPGIDQIGSIYPSTRSFSFGVQLSLF